MAKLMCAETPTALWKASIDAASEALCVRLDEHTHSYLVFLLMRHVHDQGLGSVVVAVRWLEAQQARGELRRDALKRVGDVCLLLAGLYPQLARRRRLSLSYYPDMGRSAYAALSELDGSGWADVYAALSERFGDLADVLRALRGYGSSDAMLAAELALEQHSAWGRRALRTHSAAHAAPAPSTLQ